MDIRWLRTFVTAAELENFRHTAERLYIAQPTVTVHIRRLENEIGTRFFRRSGRNIVLTEAGRRFLPHAKQILSHHDSGLHDLLSWRQGYKKKLILAVSPLIAGSILPYIIQRFTGQHQDTEVIVQVAESKDIGEMIEKKTADIGLSRMKPVHLSLTADTLYEDPIMCVAPHDGGDFETSPPLDIDELFEQQILFTHNHPGFWDDLLADIRMSHYPPRTMVVSQVHITKRFIEEGLGFSFLPKSSIRRELMEGRLLKVETKKLHLPVAATYIVTRHPTEEAQKFIVFLREYYKKPLRRERLI
ncbi:MAG TPA: LysR family transcriptional regulator [Bacillales bacterium]|nr:LysR family transcriptional regulator [Bacillales bacterium]